MTQAKRLSNILKRIESGDERFGFAAAGIGHALLLALLALNLAGVEELPPLMSKALAVDIVDGSDAPMFGDPDGDDAPPPAVESETQPEEPVEEELPQPEPVEPTEDAPVEPQEVQQPTQTPNQASATPRPAPANPSDRIGNGRIAFGSPHFRGLGGGLDGDIMRSIAIKVAEQIRPCWDVPFDKAPDNLSITMVVNYDIAGNLIGEPRITRLIDEQEVLVETPNSFEQAAIDAAKRCTPVTTMPPAHYRYWRQVPVLIFSDVLPEQVAQRQAQAQPAQRSATGL